MLCLSGAGGPGQCSALQIKSQGPQRISAKRSEVLAKSDAALRQVPCKLALQGET